MSETKETLRPFQKALEGIASAERSLAMQKALDFGVPTKRDEAWKYTNLSPLFTENLVFESPGFSSLPQLERAKGQIVFLNGIFSQELSDIDKLGEGVKVTPLDSGEGVLEVESQPKKLPNLFSALNEALYNAGVAIIIEPSVQVEPVLDLRFYFNDESEEASCVVNNIKNVIHVKEGAKLSIWENYNSDGARAFFTNVRTNIILEEGATVNYIKSENEIKSSYHIANIQADLKKDSKLRAYSLSSGGKLIRNHLAADLSGEGAEAQLNGLYIAKGKEHIDNQTAINHRVPKTKSGQLYKGILNDKARAVFNGKIYIEKHAQKSNASQMNKNILLSDFAEIDSKPDLEIYADDVKAAHGATVGHVEAESLFYLMSRAISEEDARLILLKGFAREVFYEVEDKKLLERVYGRFNRLIDQYFEGAPS